ncbi:hypothetical protein H0H93_013093 [Arthromyces matolae]|nr:hypothetical protein H0H93_013093 [Arthromyces matolae]
MPLDIHLDASYGLTVPTTGQPQGSQFDSPGSSVFDLPTHGISVTPDITVRRKPQTPKLEITEPQYGISNASVSFVVLSGGTGGNAICAAFENASYVLPVSDDGGSSSEIIRVLGGPSIVHSSDSSGDIRSRLIRLIPISTSGSPLHAICRLLSYRLPARCSEREARDEWREIVEGRNSLWAGIPPDRKETIRGNAKLPSAAQGFFRSLPSAIFLFSSITGSQEDGRRLVGQCEISHPVPSNSEPVNITFSGADAMSPVDGMGEFISQRQNMMFESSSKAEYESLGSRISSTFKWLEDCQTFNYFMEGLFYLNAYGIEIHPTPNPDYLAALASKEVLVYSCVNSTNDRETEGYTAVDYIQAIVRTLNSTYQMQPYGLGNANTTYPISAFVTHLVYLKDGTVQVDVERITKLGVRCVQIASDSETAAEATRYDAEVVQHVIEEILAGRTEDTEEAEQLLQPSLLRRTRPGSNSSSASSLTRENVKQHNALLASHDHNSASDLHGFPKKIDAHGSSASQTIASSLQEGETSTQTDPFQIESTDVEPSPRPPHVHFRPRVRITSGINRHRHTSSFLAETTLSNSFASPSSSVSSSPCSSISAPLHSKTDDEADKPGWGPLGRRVALLSRQTRRRALPERFSKKDIINVQLPPCEHTPLLRPRIQSPIIDADGNRRMYDVLDSESLQSEEEVRQARAGQIDAAFGTMPRRLLNHRVREMNLQSLHAYLYLKISGGGGNSSL